MSALPPIATSIAFFGMSVWVNSGHSRTALRKQKDRLVAVSPKTRSVILIRWPLAHSAFCASRADRLGGKVQRSSTQALSIAFAARCGFEDAFGQRGLQHRGLQFRRKAGPSVVKSLSQKGDGFRIKNVHLLCRSLSPHVLFRLARDLLMNVTTVWQSHGHCLTFCFQRFELTANGSRSIE
jgi:hypothetical protein